MILNGDWYILVSGRRVYSNCGILGLGEDVAEGVSEGYDGWLETDDSFTREEREDIANEMIQRWTRWRDRTDGMIASDKP